jgi:hypothetical protein
MKKKKKTKKKGKKMANIKGMNKVARNVELFITQFDNSNRFGKKVIPNKKKKVKKFNPRKDAD